MQSEPEFHEVNLGLFPSLHRCPKLPFASIARGAIVDAQEVDMEKETKDILGRLEKLDCASLCDASPLVRSLIPGILVPLHPHLKMIGRVYPINCSNDYLTVIKEMSEARAGDVLVIDGRGQTQAIFGELLAAEAKRKGLAGAVVDGAVRDINGMKELDFPVYYRCSNPRAGRAEVVELPTEVVSVCGATAVAGDWIMGDADGVVIIPGSQAETIVLVAEEIQKVETKVFKSIKGGESLIEIIKLEEFRRAHEREIRSNLEYHLSGEK